MPRKPVVPVVRDDLPEVRFEAVGFDDERQIVYLWAECEDPEIDSASGNGKACSSTSLSALMSTAGTVTAALNARPAAPIYVPLRIGGEFVGHIRSGGREGRPTGLEAAAATYMEVAKLRDGGMTWGEAELVVAERERLSDDAVKSRVNKVRRMARMLRKRSG